MSQLSRSTTSATLPLCLRVTYVRHKKLAAEDVGFRVVERKFPAGVSEAELAACVEELNRDPEVHAIL